VKVHLIDGTYELFRHYFAVPPERDAKGREIGAVRGVVRSVWSMIEAGATHLGVATDHVIESFRNELYAGYKTGEGVPEELMSQFPLLEAALQSMGVVVWAMVEFEADDALAAAAAKAAEDPRVEQVLICTPDKDLAQCVRGNRVVQVDRRRAIVRDAAAVVEKFGVRPESIPDWLAVVGDSADGFPGIPAWGAKSAAAVLREYPKLEDVPKSAAGWAAGIASAKRLSQLLNENWDSALLFRTLATLRQDAPVMQDVEDLRWRGAQEGFAELCVEMKMPELWEKVRMRASLCSSAEE
jgi:5'-3' exonuclease